MKRPAKKINKIKVCISLLILIIIIVLSSVLFISRISPAFVNIASKTASSKVSAIISETARVTLENSKDTINGICKSSDTAMLKIDTLMLNILRADFSDELIKKLDEMSQSYIFIPFGNVFKNSFMQGSGIKIPIKAEYTTVPEINIDTKAQTCGINQVKYSATLSVTVEISIVSAYICETRTVKTEVPIYENIIIGNVPSYYTSGYIYSKEK